MRERENGRTIRMRAMCFASQIAFCLSKGFDGLIRLVRFPDEKTFVRRLDATRSARLDKRLSSARGQRTRSPLTLCDTRLLSSGRKRPKAI